MTSKTTLGRGLSALFPDLATDAAERPAFILCGIEEMVPNRYQPRKDFSEKEQKQLVASIKKNGLIQPIVVRRVEGGYEIIAGERRWRAAQEAGLKRVPVVIRTAEEMDMAELSLIENIQREALNALEEAEAYTTLISRFGLSQEDIAARVGKDRSTVTNTIRLLKLPDDAKKALVRKDISSGHARALLALESAPRQCAILKTVVAKGLSVRETERLITLLKHSPDKTKKTKKNPYLSDVEKKLSQHLHAKVTLRKGPRSSGSLDIRFASEDDLNRILRLLMKTPGAV